MVSVVSLWEYLLLDGVEVHTRELARLLRTQTREAQDVFEGVAHVLVPVGVDDGVHEGVALGQHQEVLLVGQDFAGFTQTVQEQQHQPRRPAHHETSCRTQDQHTLTNTQLTTAETTTTAPI